MDERYIIRMLGIPPRKTKQELFCEFENICIGITNIFLAKINETINAEFAFIEFQSEIMKEKFVNHFTKMQDDIIYKNLLQP